jgi:outer membrane biosynthesis protein TonB
MSISYYGVTTTDPTRIGPLVEGAVQLDIPPIDVPALYRALTTRTRLRGPEHGTLKWEDSSGGYIFVDLSPTCALVTQGTGGGDDGFDVMIDIVSTLHAAGVNVYDPQQGSWFPGSPVKQQKKTKAEKPKNKATTKKTPKATTAKAKPAAKKAAKPTPKKAAKPKPKAKPKPTKTAKPKPTKAKPKKATKPKPKKAP